MKTKISLTLFCTLAISLFIACNSTTKKATNAEATAVTETHSDTETVTSGAYTSKMTKSDKKKYFDGSKNVVYEIKYKTDGFKLRTPSSNLLWKVKLYDGKVKISNNEENLNPYEIKLTETYKAKLVKNDETIARTSYDLGVKKQSVAAVNDTEPAFFETSYSPSLLLHRISEIPEDQKNILIQELKAKGY